MAIRVGVPPALLSMLSSVTLLLEFLCEQLFLGFAQNLFPDAFVQQEAGPLGQPFLQLVPKAHRPAALAAALPFPRRKRNGPKPGSHWTQVCYTLPGAMVQELQSRLASADTGWLDLGHGIHATALVGSEHKRVVRLHDVPHAVEEGLHTFLNNCHQEGTVPFRTERVWRQYEPTGLGELPSPHVDLLVSCNDGATPPTALYLLAAEQEEHMLELVDPLVTASATQIQRWGDALRAAGRAAHAPPGAAGAAPQEGGPQAPPPPPADGAPPPAAASRARTVQRPASQRAPHAGRPGPSAAQVRAERSTEAERAEITRGWTQISLREVELDQQARQLRAEEERVQRMRERARAAIAQEQAVVQKQRDELEQLQRQVQARAAALPEVPPGAAAGPQVCVPFAAPPALGFPAASVARLPPMVAPVVSMGAWSSQEATLALLQAARQGLVGPGTAAVAPLAPPPTYAGALRSEPPPLPAAAEGPQPMEQEQHALGRHARASGGGSAQSSRDPSPGPNKRQELDPRAPPRSGGAGITAPS